MCSRYQLMTSLLFRPSVVSPKMQTREIKLNQLNKEILEMHTFNVRLLVPHVDNNHV
jgi:hypothetical protein